MNVVTRAALPGDGAAIAAVYSPHVTDTYWLDLDELSAERDVVEDDSSGASFQATEQEA